MALGLNVTEPDATCDDENCPFHGQLSVRGQTLEGTVASTDMDKTVVVEREYDVAVPKYDRQMKRRSRVPAHAPACLDLDDGDDVTIAETRPLSKTKSHVVVAKHDAEGATDSDVAAAESSQTESGGDA
ncbi:MAG: 30S ribosomal protein S17 [Haloarculaceae archaeon]